MCCKYFLQVYSLPFGFLDGTFQSVKFLNVDVCTIYKLFPFMVCAFCVLPKKLLHIPRLQRFSKFFFFFNIRFICMFCFGRATQHGMWDLSSLNRDRTHAPCSGSSES